MKKLIKEILSEDVVKRMNAYKFAQGGYIIPCKKSEGTVFLSDDEVIKLKKLNENMEEIYVLHKKQVELMAKHNEGTMIYAIEKMRKS
jgi:hypothetical protein